MPRFSHDEWLASKYVRNVTRRRPLPVGIVAATLGTWLYLESPETDASKILNSRQLKQVRMHFIHDVDKGKLAEAWNAGKVRPTVRRFREPAAP